MTENDRALMDHVCKLLERIVISRGGFYQNQDREKLNRLREQCGYHTGWEELARPVADSDGSDGCD